jgi:butyrate kinase
MKRILAINPGATSTKFAIFDDEQLVFKKIVEHRGAELKQFEQVFDQRQYRTKLILDALKEADISLSSLNAVAGRGGILKPLTGGTYAVNDKMLEDLEKAERAEHPSNLGGVLAYNIANPLGIPAFIVDPVSVDELEPVARISGSPEFERVSECHALNMKAVARKVAKSLGKKYSEFNVVVAHLGSGVSLSVQSGGKMIDISNGGDEGAFAPDRCGGVPVRKLVKLCYSGKYTFKELNDKIYGSGGIYAYLGTKDIRQVENLADDGNEKAKLLLEALCYQVAKEIGSLATVVSGQVERIILTGGMAYSKRIVENITKRVQSIASVVIIPGEEELESLATGALRVIQGEETARIYL